MQNIKYIIQYQNNGNEQNNYNHAKEYIQSIKNDKIKITQEIFNIIENNNIIPIDIISTDSRINILPFIIYQKNKTNFIKFQEILRQHHDNCSAYLWNNIKEYSIGINVKKDYDIKTDQIYTRGKLYPCYGNEFKFISVTTFNNINKLKSTRPHTKNIYNIQNIKESIKNINIPNQDDIKSIQYMIDNKKRYTEFKITPIHEKESWENNL